MKLSAMKPDVSKRRFPLPNEIWTWKLKPPAFAVLAYLQYRYCRKIQGVPVVRELVMRTHMSAELARDSVDRLTRESLLTDGLVPTLPEAVGRNFFTMPDEVFYLGLGHGTITVYAYLLCCEDRRAHQCHPSYNTIADATGLSVNTVMKCVTTLVDKQLITMEHTSYMDDKSMKWTGNNCYTILPMQQATDTFYQQKMNCLKEDVERQRIAKRLRKSENNV